MGMRMPETCWTVFKRQVINLRSCCILLVDSVESMLMHGLANPKISDTYFQNMYILKNMLSWKLTLCVLIEIYGDFSRHSASRNMKITCSFKMVVNLYQTTMPHIQRHSILPRQSVWNSYVNSFFFSLSLFLRIKVTYLQDVMSCGCLSLSDLPFFHKYFNFVHTAFTMTKHTSLSLDVRSNCCSSHLITIFVTFSPHG